MVNIGFWTDQICERGTEIAVFDYAFFNQKLLNNKSFIFYNKNSKNNNDKVINKFSLNFPLFPVNDFTEVDNLLLSNDIKIIYIIKCGYYDGKISKVAKNVIHCVFSSHQPHGDVYATISKCINGNNGKYPVIPHMINIPYSEENSRKELNIPECAIIFGRYGGFYEFNLNYAHSAIFKVASNNKNIFFLFANTEKFCDDLFNIIHLEPIIDLDEKRKFINTCDAMIWGRKMGETFGLSIGEFSSCNKPIIATKDGDDKAHVDLLGDKGIWYSDEETLISILNNFSIDKNKDWNSYKDYTPEKVIDIFNKTAILPFHQQF